MHIVLYYGQIKADKLGKKCISKLIFFWIIFFFKIKKNY